MMHNGHLARSIGYVARCQFTTYTENRVEQPGSVVLMASANVPLNNALATESSSKKAGRPHTFV